MEALSFKPGPTQSGNGPLPPPSAPVGGEMLGIDKLSVFLSNYWLLVVLLLLVPLTLLIYKKRNVALRLLTPLMSRLPIA